MNTTFLLSGGAGRVICAIPGLESYHINYPEDDFKVLIYGWDNLFDCHPLLQNRTYSADMKGVFELIVKDSLLVNPEPYHNWYYYNQQCSLIEAFNATINGYTSDPSTIPLIGGSIPNLYLQSNETSTAKLMIQQAKDKFKKDKFIVFQPFGSIMTDKGDSSGRSLTTSGYDYLANELSNDAVVLYFGDIQYNNNQRVLTARDVPGADLRFFMAMIANYDYFVGVDSVGQHIARSFDKPGTVLMGSTFERNVTYPDWFKIYRKKDSKPYYSPIRISPAGSDLADKVNDGIMDFTKPELDAILTMIRNDMK